MVSFPFGKQTSLQEKNDFWDNLITTIIALNKPCFLIGDFNEILSPADKLGGIPPHSSRFLRLHKTMNELNLMDTKTVGFPFTWRKSLNMNHNILERLDRVLIPQNCVNYLPQITVQHHPFTTSDHCLISFSLGTDTRKLKLPFRYDNAWGKERSFSKLVHKVWTKKCAGSFMHRVAHKLKLLKFYSKEWAKKRQTYNNNYYIKQAEEYLSKLYEDFLNDPANIDTHRKIKKPYNSIQQDSKP